MGYLEYSISQVGAVKQLSQLAVVRFIHTGQDVLHGPQYLSGLTGIHTYVQTS